MTARELIEKLSTFDGDLPVTLYSDGLLHEVRNAVELEAIDWTHGIYVTPSRDTTEDRVKVIFIPVA